MPLQPFDTAPHPFRLRDAAVVGFGLTLAVMVVGGTLGYVNSRKLSDNREMVVHSYEITTALDSLLSTLRDAETTQRGYLLTEDESSLQEYENAATQVREQLARLDTLTAQDGVQRDRLAALEPLVQRRMRDLSQTLALARLGDRDTALASVRGRIGARLMDETRRQIGLMQRIEHDLLQERAAELETHSRLTAVLILLTAIVGGVLISLLFYLVRRHGRQQSEASAIIARQAEHLRTTLASIGDAVISTDTAGRVTSMNAVAESLTGWTLSEVDGHPLDSFFNIVSEQTHAPVESPVTRALREGTVVPTSNHTVLVARDGAERPIDHSAAPIRDASDRTAGCVLVFHDVTERRRAEAALRDSEQRLRLALEAAQAGVWSWEPAGGGSSWDVRFHQQYGFAAEEGQGFDAWMSRIHPDDRTAVSTRLDAILATPGDDDWRMEFRVRRPDGEERWRQSLGRAERAEDGRVTRLTGMDLDITEAKASEAALRRWESIFNHAGWAVATAVPETGVLELVNPAFASMHGYEVAEIVGRPLHDLVSGDARDVTAEQSRLARETGDHVYETTHVRADGTTFPVLVHVTTVNAQADGTSYLAATFEDISRLKQAETATRIERERLDFALTAAGLGHWELSLSDGTVQRTLQHDQIFGYGSLLPEWTFESFLGHVVPDDRQDVVASFEHAMAHGTPWDIECRIRRADDQERLIWIKARLLPDADGSGQHMLGLVGDITERRLAVQREGALAAEAAQANAKFRAFFDQGALLAAIMSVDGIILEANRLSWEGCGFTKDQIIGRPFWECPWWSPSPALMAQIEAGSRQAAHGRTFRAEMPYFVGDASERVVDIIILPIKDEAGNVMFLAPTGTDITDRKRAEEDRHKFVSLAENSTDFIGISNMQYVPIYLNRAGMDMVGLDDLESQPGLTNLDFFFPEDHARIAHEFMPAVTAHGAGEIEVRLRHFKSGEAVWVLHRVFSLTSPEGDRVGLATVSRDITDRKHLEDTLRGLAADLSESSHRKDEFLATLAHELRNPLAPIRNGLQVIRLSGGNQAAVDQARAMMERQLAQMVRLVDDLLDASRISRGKLEMRKSSIELASVVNQAVETSRPMIDASGHVLTVQMPSQPMIIHGDATRLSQVFANLLNNASKYTERGGAIVLSVAPAGAEVTISVKDNGQGIPADMLPKIFDLFTQVDRSLERSQSGLGIGLTLARRLVEMHDGTIDAASEGPGRGSEFTVRLPASAPEATDADAAPAVDARADDAERHRILVADDNADAVASLAMMLEFMGHDVRTAGDGLAAVAVAEDFRPELILLDIGMPLANGYEACRRIRERPWGQAVVVVALTGWGHEEDKRRSQQAGFDQHMVKPVDPAAVERLLASLSSADA